MMELLQVVGGLVILVIGGECLVRGAVALANKMGVPTLIVGLTIVSFGTSAPEMVISIQAVLDGLPDISIGNIIGSNIANILLVLGITAVIAPIAVDSKILKRDAPLMMFATVLFAAFMFSGQISRIHAAIFLGMMVIYTLHLFRSVKSGEDAELLEELEEETDVHMASWKAIGAMIIGLVMLAYGSDIMVAGASDVARAFGVTEAMIGLTIVALGTSAPELVTCVVAALRNHSDIALGNIIGSNLFNIAVIGGTAAMVHPIAVNSIFLEYDVWLLILVTLLLLTFMLTDRKLCRKEGAVLGIGYIAYSIWQIQQGNIAG